MDRSGWVRWIALGTLGALIAFLAFKKIRDVMPKMMGAMMRQMMQQMPSAQKIDAMHEMMPKIMENCLGPMDKDERNNMLSFCRAMLKEMEQKYS